MVLATDRIQVKGLRVLGFGLFSVALATLGGCSELRGFRQTESPKLAKLSQPSTDPYLAANQTAASDKAKPDPILADAKTARSTLHPSLSGTDSKSVDSGPNLAVNLEAPISSASAPRLDRPAAQPRQATEQPMVDARSIVAKSKAKLATLTSYQVRINRQERVSDSLQPPEDVLLSIRREPKAVRLEWPNGSHKGREVLYSANEPGGMMHVNAADSLVPVPRLSFAPDSPIVMRNSRHPITEAGFDTILLHIEESLASNDPGATNSYGGIETPKSVGRPCHKLMRTTPNGERWLVYIDKQTLYPTMVEASNLAGDLLERYIFIDVIPNPKELASNDAFDPDRRWGSSTGFLGRLARSAGVDAKPTATPIQR